MAETILCPQCGTNQPLDARFCRECGTSLVPATGPTTRLGGLLCPSCGTPTPENAQFCVACGQPVGSASPPGSQRNPRTTAWDRPRPAPMVCPRCRTVPLLMAERHGIEVEYCPTCRGVWLDRGELDKIIERVALTQGGSPRDATQWQGRRSPAYPAHHDDDDDDRRKKKRRGLLDELFDFD